MNTERYTEGQQNETAMYYVVYYMMDIYHNID